jgi:peptidoglycan-N-acetylglucosamine deacetylase
VLRAAEIKATFYVPGHTADHHPGVVSALLDRHEVVYHGYLHLRTDDLTAEQQRAEIEMGSISFPGCHVTVQLGRRWR